MKRFMIDIETTGTRLGTDSILQVGILEMNRDKRNLYEAGRSAEWTLYFPGKPDNEFAIREMSHVYSRANEAIVTPAEVRRDLLKFLFEIEPRWEHRQMVGLNLSTFDLPFLHVEEILFPLEHVYDYVSQKDVLKGDYHYRVYDISSALTFGADCLNVDRDALNRQIKLDAQTRFEKRNLEGRPHTALYDCFFQLDLLNELIRAVGGWD